MLRLNPKQILEKSIKSGINMKFTDFIKFNAINLNESYVDTFFHNLQSDIPIYMSEQMIEYFGYKGDAKIQKQTDKFERDSEADLKGHIEVKIKDMIEKTAKNSKEKQKLVDENIDVYQKDYQLARAIDLIRGIGLYNSIIKK